MAIRAVAFDIGGVLEITRDTGMTEKWEQRLHLKPGELDQRMASVWRDGSLGKCSEEHVQQSLREIIGMDQAQVDAFLHDLWEEYLGTLNVELAAYFSSLRSRYQTAIISNSFVGARTREQERYHFEKMTDLIIYSHEVGIAKPDRRIYALTCERLGVQPAFYLASSPSGAGAVGGVTGAAGGTSTSRQGCTSCLPYSNRSRAK